MNSAARPWGPEDAERKRFEKKLRKLPRRVDSVALELRSSFLGKIPDDKILQKAEEWTASPLYASVNIPIEIRKAALWCSDNPRRKPRSNYIRFLGNWLRKCASSAKHLPSGTKKVIQYFIDRFSETHGGDPPELEEPDAFLIHGVVEKRGPYKTLVLIDGFFQMEGSGWRFFPDASRSVRTWKSQINKMLIDREVRAYLEERKQEGESWFVKHKYLSNKEAAQR